MLDAGRSRAGNRDRMLNLPGSVLYQLERRLRAPMEVPSRYADHHVLLASFPRSGNTWLRFIIANVARLRRRDLDEVIDFASVHRYAPTVRNDRRLEDVVEAPGLPLFIKTHFPYISGFHRYRRVLVVRHPADSLLSYYWFLKEGRRQRVGSPAAVVRSWRYGSRAWAAYHQSWKDRADIVVHYEDLRRDPVATVAKVYEELGVEVDSDVLTEAVLLSSKDRMRRLLVDRGDPHLPNQDFQVVRAGVVGEGSQVLDPSSWDYLKQTCADVAAEFGYDFDQKPGAH
jgi:hypothetical protein